MRREIAERYGEKKLYEGGLSVRATLDPKMQAMARKALVDGLVRYDEARGWRGAQQKLDLTGREWGLALAEVPALGDVAALAAGASCSRSPAARPGSACSRKREASGQVVTERETGVVTADGVKWTRRNVDKALNAGDVIYVEPMDGKPGQFRLRQIPEISGAIVAMDPYTGRVHAMVGGFSFDQSEFNRATQAHAPAGLVVQADRLRDRARQRLHAVQRSSSTRRSPSTWARARRPGRRQNYDGKSAAVRTRCATASSIRRT